MRATSHNAASTSGRCCCSAEMRRRPSATAAVRRSATANAFPSSSSPAFPLASAAPLLPIGATASLLMSPGAPKSILAAPLGETPRGRALVARALPAPSPLSSSPTGLGSSGHSVVAAGASMTSGAGGRTVRVRLSVEYRVHRYDLEEGRGARSPRCISMISKTALGSVWPDAFPLSFSFAPLQNLSSFNLFKTLQLFHSRQMLCIGGSQIPFGWSFLSIARVPMAWSPGDVWTAELDLPLGVSCLFVVVVVEIFLGFFLRFRFFFPFLLVRSFVLLSSHLSLFSFLSPPSNKPPNQARVEYKYVILEEQDWTKHESADAEGIVSRKKFESFSFLFSLFFSFELTLIKISFHTPFFGKNNPGRVRVPQPRGRGRGRRP